MNFKFEEGQEVYHSERRKTGIIKSNFYQRYDGRTYYKVRMSDGIIGTWDEIYLTLSSNINNKQMSNLLERNY